MHPAAKQKVVRGAVRIIVIAPIAFGFSVPLIVLFHSLLPLYAGVFAGTVVVASGAMEVGRGLKENRADQRALPQARIIE